MHCFHALANKHHFLVCPVHHLEIVITSVPVLNLQYAMATMVGCCGFAVHICVLRNDTKDRHILTMTIPITILGIYRIASLSKKMCHQNEMVGRRLQRMTFIDSRDRKVVAIIFELNVS